MNLGIFGGTFDPVHTGHLLVAEFVREKLGLDRVLLIPSRVPPHKRSLHVAPARHRVAMLRSALRGNSALAVSDVEIRRAGVSYTADTLAELRLRHGSDRLFLLIGMDNAGEFAHWKNPDEILRLATVVVMTRPGFSRGSLRASEGRFFLFCRVPEVAISSREVRRRVKASESIRYMVPASVEAYIKRHRLYR